LLASMTVIHTRYGSRVFALRGRGQNGAAATGFAIWRELTPYVPSKWGLRNPTCSTYGAAARNRARRQRKARAPDPAPAGAKGAGAGGPGRAGRFLAGGDQWRRLQRVKLQAALRAAAKRGDILFARGRRRSWWIPKTALYLKGTEVDYTDKLIGAGLNSPTRTPKRAAPAGTVSSV